MRFGRRIHQVAEALHRDIGLLEFLPQADDAQHGLAHARGEHLEGDEHADGEAVVLHDQQGADDEDGERHRLLEAVGEHVVGVADLPRGEAGSEVVGQKATVFLLQVRLHLQRLDGGDAGDVFGEEGLVPRAEQELPVELVAEDGRDGEADEADQAQERHGDERELPGVPEHHREEDEQEGKVEDQAHGGAGDELADGLDAVQARHQHAGGAVLEEGQRQAQQVAEDLAAEHGVDAVAGVQHQILAQPCHGAGEDHEQDQRHADDGQRGLRLVHHHLVDDDLGEDGRGEADELDGEGGEQHVAPDALVLEEFGNEPAEAEFGVCACFTLRPLTLAPSPRGGEGGVAGSEDDRGFEVELELGERQRFGLLGSGAKV